jgi:hypothetical protein
MIGRTRAAGWMVKGKITGGVKSATQGQGHMRLPCPGVGVGGRGQHHTA